LLKVVSSLVEKNPEIILPEVALSGLYQETETEPEDRSGHSDMGPI
jgi:hypothetical protein